MPEIIDLYTKDREKTGITAVRGKRIPNNLYKLIVHVCIFNREGKMLIQQKADQKNKANIWDFSAGGSAIAGENSAEAIRRELKEEIGIDYDFTYIKPRLTVYFGKCFNDIYILKNLEPDLDSLSLQTEEVKAVKWATKKEILELIDKKAFVRYDRSYIELLFFMHRNGEGCIKNPRPPKKRTVRKSGSNS